MTFLHLYMVMLLIAPNCTYTLVTLHFRYVYTMLHFHDCTVWLFLTVCWRVAISTCTMCWRASLHHLVVCKFDYVRVLLSHCACHYHTPSIPASVFHTSYLPFTHALSPSPDCSHPLPHFVLQSPSHSFITLPLSPWIIRIGWIGVKHQIAYLLVSEKLHTYVLHEATEVSLLASLSLCGQ